MLLRAQQNAKPLDLKSSTIQSPRQELFVKGPSAESVSNCVLQARELSILVYKSRLIGAEELENTTSLDMVFFEVSINSEQLD